MKACVKRDFSDYELVESHKGWCFVRESGSAVNQDIMAHTVLSVEKLHGVTGDATLLDALTKYASVFTRKVSCSRSTQIMS